VSDAYLEKSDNPMLELTVKVININPSAHHPILQECRSIYEYSWFVQRIRDYTRQGDSRDSAIQKSYGGLHPTWDYGGFYTSTWLGGEEYAVY